MKLIIICLLIGAVFGRELTLENSIGSQLDGQSQVVVEIDGNNGGLGQGFSGFPFGGK